MGMTSFIAPSVAGTTRRGGTRPPAPRALLALELRGALLEERGEALVRVLARGEDAEQAALEPQRVVQTERQAAIDRLDHRGHRERTVLEHRERHLLGL